MKPANSKKECPVKYTINILSGKWKLKTLWELQGNECIRFNELRRRIEGISNVALKRALLELEEDGIIKRVQYDEVPPKVEYSLTEKGRSLNSAFLEMIKWANTYDSNTYSLEEILEVKKFL
ncbi:transcriptional regulator [Propionigenium maris DSM 9537]|uniref:Transcriptional regulator n=1 Tax=Propionigenium maris DSM 9537 TaxID=1123000 RepID=A0A9W6LQ47_9FUSO|nr:helix-turn-helix domain-containing protein [Propionigenium maris]GLI57950.1 transcriptional regulator [Propionigenium maris DSM 9537]